MQPSGQLKAIFAYTGPLHVSDSVIQTLKKAKHDKVGVGSCLNTQARALDGILLLLMSVNRAWCRPQKLQRA